MTVSARPGMLLRVKACAKVNLSLEILGVRRDGYHEVHTVLQTIALADTLTISRTSGPFRVESHAPDCPAGEGNIVWKAAVALWRASGKRGVPRDLLIRIEKRIPMQAGLGGGSSDAAAALRALSILWRTRLNAAALQRIGARLGADVPFFVDGGTSLGIGRGDDLLPLPDVRSLWVVLAIPDFGVSTKDAYGWWDRQPRVALHNDLQAVVSERHPEIARIVRRLQRAGATHAAMSGSGSAVFGLFGARTAAEAARSVLARTGRALLTRTVSRRRYRTLCAPVLPVRR